MQFLVILVSLATLAAAIPTARDCSAQVERFNLGRREARGLAGRATYKQLLNNTCVLSPETGTDGYVPNAPIRSNIADNEPGVPLIMDVGVMDVTTCQPLPNVMVELWGANTLGVYDQTSLRGATQTESSGIAEFQTIFPGVVAGAATHLNIKVHTNNSDSSGTVAHEGRLFFYDSWTYYLSIYMDCNENKNSRIENAQDPVYAAASQGGFFPVIDTESIGDDFTTGIIGYITVGVNPDKVL